MEPNASPLPAFSASPAQHAGIPVPFTACSKMKMAEKMLPSAFSTVSLEMCAELCSAVVLPALRSKAAFWLVTEAMTVPPCSSFSLLPSPAVCSGVRTKSEGEYGEDAGGPGGPTPQREGKEDQVAALGIINIREVLQGQTSCLQEGKLGFGIRTHPKWTLSPKCTNTPVCHLVYSPIFHISSDTLLKHVSTVMATL